MTAIVESALRYPRSVEPDRIAASTGGAIEAIRGLGITVGDADEHEYYRSALLAATRRDARQYARTGDLETFQADCLDRIEDIPLTKEAAEQLNEQLYSTAINLLRDSSGTATDKHEAAAIAWASQSFAAKTHVPVATKVDRVIADFKAAAQGDSLEHQSRKEAILKYCEAAGLVPPHYKKDATDGAAGEQLRVVNAIRNELPTALHERSKVQARALVAGGLAAGLVFGPGMSAAASASSSDVRIEPVAQAEQTFHPVAAQSEAVVSTEMQPVTITAAAAEGPEEIHIIEDGRAADGQDDQPATPIKIESASTEISMNAPEQVTIGETEKTDISATPIVITPAQLPAEQSGDEPSMSALETVIIAESTQADEGSPETPAAPIEIAPQEAASSESATLEGVQNTEEAMPDPDPNPKADETPQETIDRVVHSGDMDNTTHTILKTYSENYNADPKSVSPPNATLDTWVKEKREGLVEAVTVAAHDDSYTQDAIKAVAFLNAVQKDPGVLKDKEVQEYIAALPDMGDKYVDKLYKEHLKSAQELLASDELGKSEGLDEATLEALSKLYAYVDLATQSDTEQTERIDAIKAEEEAERKRQEEEQKRQEAKGQEQSGYSEKAIAAGKKVAKEYDAEIDAMIAAFDRLDPAKKQFMHDMVDEIEELDQDELPVNITITFAQGILESSWGQSTLASDYYNLFGMKAGSTWTGDTVDLPTREVYNGESVKVMATWAVFEDYGESFEHYAYGLIGALDRYEAATEVKDDPYKYLQAIKAAGYATDPEYVNIVWSVAETYTQDIVAKIYEKEAAVQKAMDGVKAQEQKTAKEEAAKKEAAKKAEDEEQRKREQSGDIRSQLQEAAPIIASLKDKYGDVSGKMSDSDLVSTPGLHKNGNSVTIRLHPAAMKGYEALAAAFKKEFGKEIRLTDWYRTYDTQVKVKKKKGDYAATPGKSFHGWGFAIDFASDINIESTPEHEWMEANSYKFGWINPIWAHDSRGIEEPWHWEYVGPSAREAISQEL